MTTFAGALQYREDDFPTRLLMRRGGHPTDASRDDDDTNWDAFARAAAARASSEARGATP
jgi:menaquinone-dependent protoporphyrinogen IX oxidase